MIRYIVFDMGNVLTVFHEREYIASYVSDEEDIDVIAREVCHSVEWLQMDRGVITDDEAIASIVQRVPEHLQSVVERYIREYRMEQPANPPMEELVEELKEKGYSLYLFSNTSHRFRKFSKKIKSIDYIDNLWISCEHGLLKPDREAYENFLEEFELNPEECVFIDDSPANIEAAIRVKMKGIVYYGDVKRLRQELADILEDDSLRADK